MNFDRNHEDYHHMQATGPLAAPTPQQMKFGPITTETIRQLKDSELLKSETAGAFKVSAVDDVQIGGNHYKKLGDYQPWKVLHKWLTAEEFKGYMKGEAIAYLCREMDKGGRESIEKAAHVLQGYLEMTAGEN